MQGFSRSEKKAACTTKDRDINRHQLTVDVAFKFQKIVVAFHKQGVQDKKNYQRRNKIEILQMMPK